ncbi:uncharacterized protein [Nicotiana tomentosiformis]|uniref:uncharacterized protein n=1 Tax=Nicotiana tomentosiformis TaxID=4098 RepID=UPI00388C9203
MGRIENMFQQMMEKNADSDAQLASHTTSIHNLEALNTHPNGALPIDVVVNPKDGNNTGHAMALITRSGRVGDASTSNKSVEETQEEVNPCREYTIDISELIVQKAKAPVPKPPPTYPQRRAKQNGEYQFKNFIQMMKGLSINLPLVEALEQILVYAKFMKDLVTKKGR